MAEILWHNLGVKDTIEALKADIRQGLSQKEVVVRQQEFGKNLLPQEKSLSEAKIFFGQLRSPLIYILLFAGFTTVVFKEYADSLVIFGAVFLNTLVGFLQENKTARTLVALKKIIKRRAEVLREGNFKIIDSENIVPGDIIILNPGDRVSADGRIIESRGLKINEMSLTGEWLAAEKFSETLKESVPLADRDNMLYMGTVVEAGEGRAVITETGLKTEIGKIAGLIKQITEEKTPYQKKLSRFAKIVGIIIGIISFGIFIEGVLTGGEFLEMFTTSVAIAVAAIPEGLPVAMTVILALGAQRILKKQGLVRKLASAETLGATSVICSDKTATLTEGRMEVSEIVGDKFSSLKTGVFVSKAFIENPRESRDKWIFRGEPTERAILEAGVAAGIDCTTESKNGKIGEIIFNSKNKFSASLHRNGGTNLLYVLGAPEIILELSHLKSGEKEYLKNKLEELFIRGLRVIAAASKKTKENTLIASSVKELVFSGFIALKDPVRKDAKEAISICRKAGIRLIVITGDHRLTARAVAEELGLRVSEENIMDGKSLDKISDKEFDKVLPKIKIYARLEPRHKLRIVEAWQRKGEVVAMTGDGVNDAPALKKADIGVALGSGTEVAKETADLILLDDGFSIIAAAVEEGRGILDNIRKVITYLLSDSFTETVLIAGSIAISWLTNQPWVLPVLAGQILWVNLIEDGPLGLSLAFEPKEKDLMKHPPQNRNNPLLNREMKVLIFIIGFVTDFLLLGLLFWLLKYANYDISHIRTIIFAALAIDSIFYVFSCKSLRKNIWQINLFSNKFLLLSWVFGVAMLLAAIYFNPLQALLKTVPLSFSDWRIILGLGLMNIIIIEATKFIFIKKMVKSN